jgi:hypothetical protein
MTFTVTEVKDEEIHDHNVTVIYLESVYLEGTYVKEKSPTISEEAA